MSPATENAPSLWLMGLGLFVIQLVQWIAEGVASQFSNLPVVFGLLPSELICLIAIVLQVAYTFFVITFIAIQIHKGNKQEQQINGN
ncbi:hypothetical protein ACRN9C_21050 [Shewanella frigidimarina]|jgi:hypothetical protein|uniref:hypothetical protein n=1 Tax=Shewanella TaxID=22 RepID=UPI000F4E62AD|nr:MULTISPECIES: hypothetical protein [Shewanella]MBB1363910.1 hypothetical protein [Shewanella sp. SR44-4]RPA57547.1 hypothetical protein EGC86_20255 [Shewanella frigidimarina]